MDPVIPPGDQARAAVTSTIASREPRSRLRRLQVADDAEAPHEPKFGEVAQHDERHLVVLVLAGVRDHYAVLAGDEVRRDALEEGVEHEVVQRRRLAHAAQVALVGHHDARLALDRLEHEGGHVRVGGERRL